MLYKELIISLACLHKQTGRLKMFSKYDDSVKDWFVKFKLFFLVFEHELQIWIR